MIRPAAVAVLVILASAVILQAQENGTLRVGVLDEDGSIFMVGSHDERGWRDDWHKDDRSWNEREPATVSEIPPSWWGTGDAPQGPWRAHFHDGMQSTLAVRGATFVSYGAFENWMPNTDVAPRADGRFDAVVTNPTVPACRFAAVLPDAADGAAITGRVATAFGPLERREAEQHLLVTDHARELFEKLILPVFWEAAVGSPPPIRIERLQKSRCTVAGRYVYFVKAVRCYPRAPHWEGANDTVSVLQGWLAAGTGEMPVWLRRNVEIDNSIGAAYEISPMGVFEHNGSVFAIADDSAHAEYNLVVYEIANDSMRRVLTTFVSGC